MDDAAGVGVIERVGDLRAVARHHFRWNGAAFDDGRERLALDKLHGDPGLTGILADVEDGTDVGVLEV